MINRKILTFDRQYRLLTPRQWYEACMRSYRLAQKSLKS